MKIYFAGSIRAGRGDAEIYHEIIKMLSHFGEVLTEHIGDSKLTERGENLSEKFIHDRDMGWVMSADVLVAELTTPSIGVGYEIGRAVAHGKKVIGLYRPQAGKLLSAMMTGCDEIDIIEYENVSDLSDRLKNSLRK